MSWYNKNFDKSGKAKEPVTARFLVRKPSSDKAKVLSQINAEIVGEEIPWWHEGTVINSRFYADKTYRTYIFAEFGICIAAAAAYVLFKLSVRVKAKAAMLAGGFASTVAAVLLFIYIMVMT